MSLKIRRIIDDLGSQEIDIQILALTTIPRMSRDTAIEGDELSSLQELVRTATDSQNSDVVFLARKALNALDGFGTGGTPVAKPSAPSPSAPAPSAPPLSSAPVAPAPAAPAPAAPAPQAPAPQAPAAPPAGDAAEGETTVIRPPSPARLDYERQLVKEEDPRRLATLLAHLASDVRDPGLLHRVVPLLSHDDARVRANAVEVFETAGGVEHLQFIVPLTSDPNNRVRSNAIRAMARFGHPQARYHLARMLASDEVSMRESAAYTLCSLQSMDYFDLLLDALADPYEGIRLRAVAALAAYDIPESVDALKGRIADDDEAVRTAVIEALAAKGVNVRRLLEEQQAATAHPEDPGLDAALALSLAVEEAPEEEAPAPAEETPAPAEETPAPAEEAPAPAETAPAPAEEAPAPAEEVPAPAEEVPAPAEEAPAPAEEAPAPPAPAEAPSKAPAKAAGPTVEDRLFQTLVQQIGRELKQREQKAHFTRVLFKVGLKAYELCRSGAIKDVPLVVVYYEIVKYQEYLHTLAGKAAGASGEERSILEASIAQYKNRIRDAFVKVGKLASEAHRDGKIVLPDTKELESILKLLATS